MEGSVCVCCIRIYLGAITIFVQVFSLSSSAISLDIYSDYLLVFCSFRWWGLSHDQLFFYDCYCCCSVAQLCLTLWDPMDCSPPGFPVLHCLLEFAQIHVHWIGDAIQPSHLVLPPSPPAFNLSPHQGLFQWVSSSHQVAKVLELQLQHQSFQWIPRTDLP